MVKPESNLSGPTLMGQRENLKPTHEYDGMGMIAWMTSKSLPVLQIKRIKFVPLILGLEFF